MITNTVGAEAGVEVDTNYWDDSICVTSHNTTHCAKEAECNVGYGCGARKKTVTFNGDVTYSNRIRRDENGKAAQVLEACSEEITFANSTFSSLSSSPPCVEATACIPQ